MPLLIWTDLLSMNLYFNEVVNFSNDLLTNENVREESKPLLSAITKLIKFLLVSETEKWKEPFFKLLIWKFLTLKFELKNTNSAP